jgi:hypothetical protein
VGDEGEGFSGDPGRKPCRGPAYQLPAADSTRVVEGFAG